MAMVSYHLESPNLGFGRWMAADIPLATKLWGNPAVTRFISRTGQLSAEQVAERLADEVEYDEVYGLQYWPIFLKDGGSLVGCCGLHPYFGEAESAELGAHLLPEFWGKGLASEASRAVITHAFQHFGLKSLVAGHHPDNRASQLTLERLGFVLVDKKFYEPTGLWHPSYRLDPSN